MILLGGFSLPLDEVEANSFVSGRAGELSYRGSFL
jgi:hypothetical protein